jgi:hypothetical protein
LPPELGNIAQFYSDSLETASQAVHSEHHQLVQDRLWVKLGDSRLRALSEQDNFIQPGRVTLKLAFF